MATESSLNSKTQNLVWSNMAFKSTNMASYVTCNQVYCQANSMMVTYAMERAAPGLLFWRGTTLPSSFSSTRSEPDGAEST